MDSIGKTYIVTGAVPKSLISAQQKGLVHLHTGFDVSSREQISTAFEAISLQSPDIHGLVNSAGIAPETLDNLGLPEEDDIFKRIMDVNLYGTWNAGTAYLKHLCTRYPEIIQDEKNREGLGSIVNLTSESVIRADPDMASCNTSKHAVVGLTKSWAKDFVRRGVRVNCVAPGLTDTPMVRNENLDQAMVEELINSVPMKRAARPEEVAELIVFLLSERPFYMTGQVIPIEGGITI
ncbi:uncharacterized protein N7473_012793 [Penicillium subrubescens]|uniref:uncharacterized protein n=1 Tax=Penicillium subrubescens TaxID=1316194 RepID=UPI00254539B6|nr:uncharacterized protein N7473_012793 [Penicillium subrubescens]KAJ5875446.1 hypothetical protein N7473_012793 [Penicillium subrubescens]